MPAYKDLTNQRFDRLTVLSFSHKNHRSESVWLCQCDCGEITEVFGWRLTNGNTKSCGCYNKQRIKETMTRHGLSRTPLYKTWSSIIQRCTNPNNKEYHNYGGRGISVCSRWEDYNSFHQDMSSGHKPGLQIDRIDNDGDYSPENCRWVTPSENNRNRRNNKIISTPKGDMTIAEASETFNLSHRTLSYRLAHGWDLSKLFIPPLGKRG